MTIRAFIGFAGFGGPEIVLKENKADVTGVELDDDIAQVARDNGHNTITADLMDIDPYHYAGYDLMHFSPPCPSFSQANANGEETAEDIALARKVAGFIHAGKPRFFTLENVPAYRHSLSWQVIKKALRETGYTFDYWLLNAADYGVPQTRRRMIVAARLDGQPVIKPFPTHSKTGDMFTAPWVGWYEAIEDLIPSLPESEFAPWQLKRMPEELKTMLVMSGNTNMLPQDSCAGRGWLPVERPANTVTTATVARALLIPGDNAGNTTVRHAHEPMVTVQTRSTGQCPHRAFIIGGQYQTYNGTIRVVQNRCSDCPDWTITASENGDTRAFTGARVVSMTPETLARFQGFPEDYKLPLHNGLACKGIGNALPPGVYRAVLKMLLGESACGAAMAGAI